VNAGSVSRPDRLGSREETGKQVRSRWTGSACSRSPALHQRAPLLEPRGRISPSPSFRRRGARTCHRRTSRPGRSARSSAWEFLHRRVVLARTDRGCSSRPADTTNTDVYVPRPTARRAPDHERAGSTFRILEPHGSASRLRPERAGRRRSTRWPRTVGRAPAHVPGQLQPGAGLEPEGRSDRVPGRDEHRVSTSTLSAVDTGEGDAPDAEPGHDGEAGPWAPTAVSVVLVHAQRKRQSG